MQRSVYIVQKCTTHFVMGLTLCGNILYILLRILFKNLRILLRMERIPREYSLRIIPHSQENKRKLIGNISWEYFLRIPLYSQENSQLILRKYSLFCWEFSPFSISWECSLFSPFSTESFKEVRNILSHSQENSQENSLRIPREYSFAREMHFQRILLEIFSIYHSQLKPLRNREYSQRILKRILWEFFKFRVIFSDPVTCDKIKCIHD